MKSAKFMGALCGVLGLWSLVCVAGDGHCNQCGRCCECQQVCRIVCEMKEVTKTTWCCQCEDFCVQGPSQRCDSDCQCGHCLDCREESWVPTAAYVKTRKIPVKHVEKIKKPTYKFVVVNLCPYCAQTVSK